MELTVAGRAGVPGSASAVLVNLTAVNASASGYLTAYPCGSKRPLASNVNYLAGQVVPNSALVKVGDGGKVCIFTLSELDLVVDVNGFVE